MSQTDGFYATIGMGGNVGDVAAAMQWAIDAMAASGQCDVIAVSPVYRTAPWGLVNQPDFLNCCALLRTSLEPLALLLLLQKLETEGGRVRDIRWGPRTLDIDMLTFDDIEIDSDQLTLPHPRMTQRAFVMIPLADIAPSVVVAGQTAHNRASRFERDGIVKTDIELVI